MPPFPILLVHSVGRDWSGPGDEVSKHFWRVVFLLHVRQCRYYAIIMFLEVIFFYGYHSLINRQTVSGSVLISVALIGQFYCNYIIVASNIIALLLTSAYFIRKKHFYFIIDL